MPRKRRTSRDAAADAVVIKIDAPDELPEKPKGKKFHFYADFGRRRCRKPSSNAVDALAVGLTAGRINTRERPSSRVWLVAGPCLVGLVFFWWYGVASFVVDAGRLLGWW